MFLFVALLMLAAYAASSGATSLHGVWEGGLAFSFPFAIQTDSDTYTNLRLTYTTSDWILDSLSAFGERGLLSQRFGASGSLGSLVLNSCLLFSPTPGLATISYSRSTNGTEHLYDLGIPYFVDWVSVTGIAVVGSTTQWRIRTSLDNVTWDWVSGVFTGNVLSGQVRVGAVARYISIVAVTSGYIATSSVQISVSAQSWTTNVRLVTDGVTLYGTLTIATESSYLSFGIIGLHGDNLPFTGRVSFIIATPSFDLCLDDFEGTFCFSLGCLDLVTASLKMRNPTTAGQSAFEGLSLATTGLDLGLLGITFDVTLAFELAEKTVTMTPALNLGAGTCVTVYAGLGSGTAGPWEITDLSIYGIRIFRAWDGVSFESLSYLDDLHFVKDAYWEVLTIKSVGDICRGGGFEFSGSIYFDKASSSLFGWGKTETSMSFEVADGLAIRFKMGASPAGLEELVFGWLFSW